MRRLLLTTLLALALSAPAMQAQAQQRSTTMQNTCWWPIRALSPGATACISAKGCAYGTYCFKGRCIPSPERAQSQADAPVEEGGAGEHEAWSPPPFDPNAQFVTSDEACDVDRRCRINRLRRQNNARRYMTQTRGERAIERAQARAEVKRQEAIRRLIDPAILELTFSPQVIDGEGRIGLITGYTLLEGRLRPELRVGSLEDYADGFDERTGAYFSQHVSLWDVSLGVAYLFRQTWWSYYAGAYINTLFGDSYGDFGGGELQINIHALSASLGLDLQLGFGLRARVGVVARYPLYVRAAYAPGVYDEAARSGLRAWFNGDQRFDMELGLGWAF